MRKILTSKKGSILILTLFFLIHLMGYFLYINAAFNSELKRKKDFTPEMKNTLINEIEDLYWLYQTDTVAYSSYEVLNPSDLVSLWTFLTIRKNYERIYTDSLTVNFETSLYLEIDNVQRSKNYLAIKTCQLNDLSICKTDFL